jgi:hypothetical protein
MRRRSALLAILALIFASTSFAQTSPAAVGAGVPPVIRFGGTLAVAPGRVPVTFGLYQEEAGGQPLWIETQTVSVDAAGRYAVVLGTTTALSTEWFASGEARWLEVAVEGLAPQPRRLLVSVPYALKAADADTVGGKPLSAFVLAGEKTGVGADGLTYVDTRVLSAGMTSGANGQAAGGPPSPLGGSGAAGGAGSPNYVGLFTDATTLVNSVIYQTPAGSVGVNTTAPLAGFHAVSAASPVAFYDVYSNALGALPVVYRAARGTPSAPTAVQANDILGGLAVRGYGSTGFSTGRGQIMFKAAENWTDGAQGTYLQFTTTPVGGTGWLERIRVMPDGKVGIGTAAPAQALSVAGTVESTVGGFRFPDGTTQTTAATGGGGGVTRVYGGDGIAITGSLATPIVNAQFGGSGGDYGVTNFTARGDHLHGATYLPLTGGAMTGAMTITGSSTPFAMLGVSNSAASSPGILGMTTNASGIGVSGIANVAAATSAIGLYGESTAGKGVAGHSPSGYGVYGSTTSGYAGYFAGRVDVNNTSSASGARAVYAITAGADATAVSGTANNGTAAVGVRGDSAGGYGVQGQSSTGYGVVGTTTGSAGYGVYGVANNGASAVGVRGESGAGYAVYGGSSGGYGVAGSATSGRGVGGFATSGYGVFGTATTGFAGKFEGKVHVSTNTNYAGGATIYATNAGTGNAIRANASADNAVTMEVTANGSYADAVVGLAYGASGHAGYFQSEAGDGIYAGTWAAGKSGGYFFADTGWAGYFVGNNGMAAHFTGRVETTGNLSVGGTLTKAAGSFKIDHPLDPENKYLSHSFVESPDMKNIYDGVAVLDEKGEASVTLPAWFEALNRDFRYQLTAIGGPGPNLYVASEITGNRFTIAGGTPGKKVSWQVTGSRRDAYAVAHPIPVEEAKPAGEQGTYLHPEAFGQPKEKGLAAATDPDRKAPPSVR